MSRALAILKYVPAVLCGLLVVAWIASASYRAWFSFPPTATSLWLRRGSIGMVKFRAPLNWRVGVKSNETGDELSAAFGGGALTVEGTGIPLSAIALRTIRVPIAPSVTVMLPLAFGPFIRFRFPLWSYFAWTALVAAELAYYLS